jgi:hypothetical protein
VDDAKNALDLPIYQAEKLKNLLINEGEEGETSRWVPFEEWKS